MPSEENKRKRIALNQSYPLIDKKAFDRQSVVFAGEKRLILTRSQPYAKSHRIIVRFTLNSATMVNEFVGYLKSILKQFSLNVTHTIFHSCFDK